MAWPIPWDYIDREMVKLIHLLNDTHIVRTIGYGYRDDSL